MTTNRTARKDKRRGSAGLPRNPQFEDVRVIERPDGFHWQSLDGRRERGPFSALADLEADLQVQDELTLEVGETLEEAEEEIGIAAWVDPDTGEIAEEGVSRIEDH